jgi:hypothetical protein
MNKGFRYKRFVGWLFLGALGGLKFFCGIAFILAMWPAINRNGHPRADPAGGSSD